jgi:hypothetical protein
MSEIPQRTPHQLSPAAVKAVIDAYYPSALATGDRLRARALNGFTVASAVAAALVAAGLVTGLGRLGGWLGAVGVLAVALWFAAAAGYLWAVTGKVTVDKRPAAQSDAELADRRLDRADKEVDALAPRLQKAFVLTLAALMATAAALGLAAFAPADPRQEATVLLTADGARELRRVCGNQGSVVHARVDPDRLNRTLIPFRIVPKDCRGRWLNVVLADSLVSTITFDERG